MKTWTIICYRQYGIWSVTNPFPNQETAEAHADLYLRGENCGHKQDITFLEVELPA